MRSYPVVLAALALLAGSGGYITQRALSRAEAPPPVPAAAAVAPGVATGNLDWTFSGLDGSLHRLDEWRKPALVINFWATWCPPCLREIPAFVQLQRQFADRGLQFVGIALDQPEAVAEFQSRNRVNYPLLVGAEDVTRFMHALGNTIGGLPFTVVLNSAGEIVFSHQGEWAPEEAAMILREILDPQ